jgi:hypothetical protein
MNEMEEELTLSSNEETRNNSVGCVSFDTDDFSYDYWTQDSYEPDDGPIPGESVPI